MDSKILEILGIAESLGMVLSIHGESNGFVMEREVEFHPVFEVLGKSFPKLRIIFEHLSDYRSVALVEKYENLFCYTHFAPYVIKFRQCGWRYAKPALFL